MVCITHIYGIRMHAMYSYSNIAYKAAWHYFIWLKLTSIPSSIGGIGFPTGGTHACTCTVKLPIDPIHHGIHSAACSFRPISAGNELHCCYMYLIMGGGGGGGGEDPGMDKLEP